MRFSGTNTHLFGPILIFDLTGMEIVLIGEVLNGVWVVSIANLMGV
jgi:hypothetical protein